MQVEHGITELVTGTDIVDMMLRLQIPVTAVEATADSPGYPASTPESFRTELADFKLTMTGWAIEGRLVAEDPCHNLMPRGALPLPTWLAMVCKFQ
jgi:acetyl/propionyl-CoA carboxylase alpha subunit